MKNTLTITLLLLFVLLGPKTNAKIDTARSIIYKEIAADKVEMTVKTTVTVTTRTATTTSKLGKIITIPAGLEGDPEVIPIMQGRGNGHPLQRNIVKNWKKLQYEFNQYTWDGQEYEWTTELDKTLPLIKDPRWFWGTLLSMVFVGFLFKNILVNRRIVKLL